MPWITPENSGISRQSLLRREREGRIVRIDRGIYLPVEEADQDHLAEAAACMRHPSGIICLISALRLHGLGSQTPQAVWMAVPRGTLNNRPRRDGRIRVLQWLPGFLAEHIEKRLIAGVQVTMTDPSRTIIDCWRCPRLISRETALEALRDGLAHGIRRGRLVEVAKRYGVKSILPALEAIA